MLDCGIVTAMSEIMEMIETRAQRTLRCDPSTYCHCSRCLKHLAYSAYLSAGRAWGLPLDAELRQAAERYADRIAA